MINGIVINVKLKIVKFVFNISFLMINYIQLLIIKINFMIQIFNMKQDVHNVIKICFIILILISVNNNILNNVHLELLILIKILFV